MSPFVVLVAIIASVAAAPPAKEAVKAFTYSGFPSNQAYYPGQQGYYPGQQGYYPGFQGYNSGFRNGYYPGQQVYPGYQGYQGYQGYYPGYQSGYQGYYPGYQGYNRGYYPGAPAAVYPTVSAVTPASIIAPKIVAPVSPVYKPVDNKTPVILRQSQEDDANGNFKYGFETENGIVAQAAGYVKNGGTENAIQVIEGSYAYIGEDGAPVEVKYYADETGYHAVGNVVPTTPPEIVKSLEFIASQPRKPEDSKKK